MGQASQYDTITTRQVIGWYFQDYAAAQQASWVPRIANLIQSDQEIETYAGVGLAPAMREWVGPKIAKSLREYSMTITNKEFESTLAIKSKDLRRDKTGQLRMRIGELAGRAAAHDAKMLSDLIENGAATTYAACFDAKALFADDHTIGGSGTIDNSISVDISGLATGSHGSTTEPSIGEFALCVTQGIKALAGFKDDQGEPLNEFGKEFIVMVPVGLMNVAYAAVTTDYVASGEKNPMGSLTARGLKIEVETNPRLTWTDKFSIFRADSPAKPLILQQEVAPVMKALGEGSEHEFKNNEQLFSVEKAGNAGLGRFDRCVLVTMI